MQDGAFIWENGIFYGYNMLTIEVIIVQAVGMFREKSEGSEGNEMLEGSERAH